MLLDTPDPAMDPHPYGYDADIRRVLATYLPLRPEGQLALLGAWLIDHQDQQRAVTTEAAASAHDPAFTLLRTVIDQVLAQVIAYSAELGNRAGRAQAVVDHHRGLEQAAALGVRVIAAIRDENDLGPQVMAWAVTSRARRAAALAAATTATKALPTVGSG
jgi:hypothetical protein